MQAGDPPAARDLGDLRVPPGNRLEALKGDRKGQYSSRVNEQWRICFGWSEAGAEEVEFIDSHYELRTQSRMLEAQLAEITPIEAAS